MSLNLRHKSYPNTISQNQHNNISNMSKHRIIEVCLPARRADILSYSLPDALPVPPKGTRVLVPIKKRTAIGIVWTNTHNNPNNKELPFKLKNILEALDTSPLLSQDSVRFLEWMASYYLQPVGMALHEALPAGILNAKDLQNANDAPESSKKRRQKTQDTSGQNRQIPVTTLNITLNNEQKAACKAIITTIFEERFQPFLLHGVTGSGKTEVYLASCAKCLEKGKQAIIMVPEIAMTPQITKRFQDRFGDIISVIHSGQTEKKRIQSWIDIKNDRSKIVIGTRSAIFAPVSNLGLVIVDEEHDPSYKQGERFFYNARDMAVALAKWANAPVLLGSATPSISSYYHAMNGRYRLLEMPSRVENRPLPMVTIVDRTPKKRTGAFHKPNNALPAWLGSELHTALTENLAKGEQTLLFLNRRGFATYIFCQDCGYVFRCKKCDISLSWHKKKAETQPETADLFSAIEKSDGSLICHYCGWHVPALPICPQCHGQNIKASGFGTQRLVEDISMLFPAARMARLDRDEAQSPKKMQTILSAFSKGEIDILIGTQMTTKGHDFPNLTLVGVVWADISLNFPEFNAAERTFQLLSQVAGRAGRGDKPGRVIIQTMLPNSPAIQCAMRHDFKEFYQDDIQKRRILGYPPFSRLIKLTLDEKDSLRAETYIKTLSNYIRGEITAKKINTEVIGPSPCPIARLKDAFRWQLLFKTADITAQRQTGELLKKYCDKELSKANFLRIDVDPISFL